MIVTYRTTKVSRMIKLVFPCPSSTIVNEPIRVSLDGLLQGCAGTPTSLVCTILVAVECKKLYCAT